MSQIETTAKRKKKNSLSEIVDAMSPMKGKDKQEKTDDQVKDNRKMAPVVVTVKEEETPLLEDHEKFDFSDKDSILEEIEETDKPTKEHET